tara:strand:- start:218 stop:1150 length:933 start_codon:yes stop_codon:yes gene_type:complete
MKNIYDVLIIGGGLSGSLLGSMIVKRGLDVLIVEKSKLLGGRCSSKPVDGGLADYGCQLFKPKSKSARLLLEDLHKKQIVQYSNIQDQHSSYIGNYGISKIPQYLSLGVPSLTNTKIDRLRYHEGLWNAYSESKHFTSKIVIMTMPTEQVKHLLSKSTLDYDLTTPKPKYRALYTCTFSSISDIEFMESTDHKDFSWIINNSKKGIHNSKSIYTVNSSDRLTKKLQILDKPNQINFVNKTLSNYGFKQINDLKIHYWKYAFTENKSPLEYSWNPKYGIGACGDGYGYGNTDGAITSAYKIINPILHLLNQ